MLKYLATVIIAMIGIMFSNSCSPIPKNDPEITITVPAEDDNRSLIESKTLQFAKDRGYIRLGYASSPIALDDYHTTQLYKIDSQILVARFQSNIVVSFHRSGGLISKNSREVVSISDEYLDYMKSYDARISASRRQ